MTDKQREKFLKELTRDYIKMSNGELDLICANGGIRAKGFGFPFIGLCVDSPDLMVCCPRFKDKLFALDDPKCFENALAVFRVYQEAEAAVKAIEKSVRSKIKKLES